MDFRKNLRNPLLAGGLLAKDEPSPVTESPKASIPEAPATTKDEPPSKSGSLKNSVYKTPLVKDGITVDRLKKSVLSSEVFHDASNRIDAANRLIGDVRSITTGSNSRDELVRRLMNYVLTPSVKIRFEEPQADEGALDVNLLPDSLPGDEDGIRIPIRMIDLDTMNLVQTYNLGEEDEYCMLSHSWKDCEIDYQYFCRAQRREQTADPEINDDEGEGDYDKENDVNGVLGSCNFDIAELVTKLRKTWEGKTVPDSLRQKLAASDDPVGDLLAMFIKAKGVEWEYTDAKRKRYSAQVNHTQAVQEALHYERLLAFFKKAGKLKDLNKRTAEAEDELQKAVCNLDEAQKLYDDQKDEINRLRKSRQLSHLLDDMLKALQRARSARKLKNSVLHAKDIFKFRPFTKTGKRYIWLDNCCIDKTNNNELTESLARMGEWYANADFCLVHLDTPKSDGDWLKEWERWKTIHQELKDPSTTLNTMTDLHDFRQVAHWEPTWATRGWTLQELVLSKTTFYVNSNLEALQRPVDVLGRYYSFCPFIDLYTYRQKAMESTSDMNNLLGILKDPSKLGVLEKPASDETAVAETEPTEAAVWKRIIDILELWNFVVPKHLDAGTARVRIGLAVRDTINTLQPQIVDDQSQQMAPTASVYNEILENIPTLKDIERSEERIKSVIDLLLRALANETNEAIEEDRKYIARFSKIACLESWSKGIGRTNFATQSVMTLASSRQCTVATDQAYSLMGILGVRFPAFPAEGLTKALSRLLDEVVIMSNDVTVFNWSGKHNGSTIRGRSLYPCNIISFQSKEGQGHATFDRQLVELFREERLQSLMIARKINMLVGRTTQYIKNSPGSGIVRNLIRLVDFIKKNDFKALLCTFGDTDKPKHLDLFALIEKVAELAAVLHSDPQEQPSIVSEDDAEKAQERVQEDTPRAEDSGETSTRSSKFMPSRITSFKTPWGKTSPSPKKDNEDTHGGPKQDAARDETLESLKKLEPEIGKVIDDLVPENWEELNVKVEPKEKDAQPITTPNTEPKNDTMEPLDRQITCPNPIVMNSSGIKGVFDIQRVVVTMLEPNILRKKIQHALSDNEKIDGWCTISTGFAFTMVAFSCEKHILEKQLDIAEVVEETVMRDPMDRKNEQAVGKTNDASSPSSTSKQPSDKSPTAEQETKEDTTTAEPRPSLPTRSTTVESLIGQPTQLKNYGNSPEQRKVSRMIDFVTDADLQTIAGEWVLARFSGAPAAKWFLSRLELGSNQEFYARRIPTDEFDFADAVPEKGLVDFWYQFLDHKKTIMCRILSSHLDAEKADSRATELERGIGDRLDEVVSSDDDEEEGAGTAATVAGYLRTAKQVAKGGAWLLQEDDFYKFIGYSVRSGVSQLYAEYLERHLKDKALAKVPVRLQAAILDLDEDRRLLPVMFHSGRDVHFF
ncbi:hypothetical protein FE257_009629 [Aspergillus nanangensis]|uniref:Heterokaryon incompatibility domain-containing protein n=1 Tax=Aspergillus nanangensis TaxID=2582783 RepID=A0AAD4CL98_ASPNN|nr:hypothetical protein FE257_009629 [Aspergillus nanangensis]